jgi:Leucine-rich repeat (LRR) protein
MKPQLQNTFFALLICTGGFAQNVTIPDANFKAYLVGESTINTNGDAEIQVTEATAYTSQINCSDLFIADMTGIEAFTSLNELVCFNNSINSLDVSACASLTYLSCGNNNLTSLDLSNLSSLQYLGCWNNNLTSLDISNNILLESLQCQDNSIEQLDISQNTALTYFSCSSNNLSSLNMKNNSTST